MYTQLSCYCTILEHPYKIIRKIYIHTANGKFQTNDLVQDKEIFMPGAILGKKKLSDSHHPVILKETYLASRFLNTIKDTVQTKVLAPVAMKFQDSNKKFVK